MLLITIKKQGRVTQKQRERDSEREREKETEWQKKERVKEQERERLTLWQHTMFDLKLTHNVWKEKQRERKTERGSDIERETDRQKGSVTTCNVWSQSQLMMCENKKTTAQMIHTCHTGLLHSHLPYIANPHEHLSCFMLLSRMTAQVLAFL